jgi:hypothetical protein
MCVLLVSGNSAAVAPQARASFTGDDCGVDSGQTYVNVGRNGFRHAINE